MTAMLLFANDFTNHLSAWAEVAAAVGTVGAVVIVLYRDTWRAARRRPRLSISFENGDGSQLMSVADGVRGHLPGVRLSVANEAGRDTAHNVQIMVSLWSLRHPPPELDIPGEWDQRLDYRPLVWADEYQSGDVTTHATIPPGISRPAEFVRFGRPHEIQHVIDGVARAIERPPELQETSVRRPSLSRGLDFSPTPVTDDYAVLVAPPFEGSDTNLLQWHAVHRFRIIVTLTDGDSIAYDTIIRMDATAFGPDVGLAHIVFRAAWTPLKRVARPDAAFSAHLRRSSGRSPAPRQRLWRSTGVRPAPRQRVG